MKKYLIIFLTLLAAACTRQEAPCDLQSLDVTMAEPASKVGLNGLDAVWTAGDEVSVFWNDGLSERWTYQGEDRSINGKIVRRSSVLYTDDTPRSALLPYSEEATLSEGVISCVLPSSQIWAEATLPAVLMTAPSDVGPLFFRYACGYVCINLADDYSLSGAVLSGRSSEILAGAVTIDMDEDYPVACLTADASEKSIRLSAAQGSFRTSTLWFCLPAMTFQDGLSITLELASGGTRCLLFDGPLEIKRGHVLQLGHILEGKEIVLDFRGGANPFTVDFPTGQNGKYTGEEGQAFVTVDGNHEFRFHTPENDSAYGVGYRGSTYDYVMIGRTDSWIQTPAIEGFALRSVRFEAGSTSSAPKPYVSTAGDRADHVSNIIKDLVDGQEFTFWVSAQKKCCPYWINITSGNLCFRYLICTYEEL